MCVLLVVGLFDGLSVSAAVKHSVMTFLPCDAMPSADYAATRCLSVCLSVHLSYTVILSERPNKSSHFLTVG